MNLMDIIELAKQGYKPSDIKELLNLSVSEPVPGEGAQKTEEAKPPEVKPEGKDAGIDDSTNYKQMYEDMKAKNEELEKTLKDAQESNTSKDISGNEKPEDFQETLNDWAKSFM